MDQFGFNRADLLDPQAQGPSVLLPPQDAQKAARLGDPGSQALPIHAKTGREWGPENACSDTDLRMTNS